MLWASSKRFGFAQRAAAARQRHAAWLGAALRSGAAMPVIPTRPVSEGGFGPLMRSPEGCEWAQQWWERTLDLAELDLPGL